MTTEALITAKEALEALDRKKILTAYHDVFVFVDPVSDEAITDREELDDYYRTLFGLANVEFTDVQVREAGSWAVIEWTWSGTRASTGKPYAVRGVSVIELDEGKIARETRYYDPRPALA